MNDSENNLTENISEQIADLKQQNFILTLVLMIVTGTLAVYLSYQAHIMKTMVDGLRPQAMQLINNYASVNKAGMDNFANQLTAYAITHPDFQPVLKKYGWNPPPVAPKK